MMISVKWWKFVRILEWTIWQEMTCLNVFTLKIANMERIDVCIDIRTHESCSAAGKNTNYTSNMIRHTPTYMKNNTSYSKSNRNKYVLYCGNIINIIYQQYMDLDFSILQQKTQTNKVQNIVAPLLEKTRGKAALFPHRLKVSKPIACVQGKRLRSKCLAGKTLSTRRVHGPNGSVLVVFLQIFFNREDIRVQCFLWGSPKKNN